MVLNETANGRWIDLAPGESLEIALGEIRTAGYSWVVEDAGEPALQLVSERFFSPPQPAHASGTHAWVFRAERNGQGKIRLVYRRGWDASAPLSTFELDVGVNLPAHTPA